MILAEILREQGFTTLEASNRVEALGLLNTTDGIELALVDWNVPRITATSSYVRFRKHPAFNSVRLVMITTETDPRQIKKALEAGADECVMKPFTQSVVADKLALLSGL